MNSPLQEYKANSPKQRSARHLKKHSIWEPLDGTENVDTSMNEADDEDVNIVPLLPSQQRLFNPMGTLAEDQDTENTETTRNLQSQQSMPILHNKASVQSLKFTPPNQTLTPSLNTTPSSDKPNRRKHHHKRSLSHAFFSFNDPTVTFNNFKDASTSPTKLSSNFGKTKDSKPPPPPTFERRAFSLKKFTFTSAEFVLGAWLWLVGQRCESLSTTGMGYLITFDSLSLISINLFDWFRTVSPSYKIPFGTRRLETVSLFTQIIYLVFAVTYLAKESIEHALISSSEDDYDHQYGIPFPTHLILLSAILPYFANKYYNNHHSLALITGTFFYNQRKTSKFTNNPFSFLITVFGSMVWLTDELVREAHHHLFDKVIAACMTICIGYLIYPSLTSLARVLLQTAPSSTSIQILRDALKDVSGCRVGDTY